MPLCTAAACCRLHAAYKPCTQQNTMPRHRTTTSHTATCRLKAIMLQDMSCSRVPPAAHRQLRRRPAHTAAQLNAQLQPPRQSS